MSDSDASSSPRSPSVLGTHAHWQAAYAAELAALTDVGDEGEIWFGESVEAKTAALVVACAPPPAPSILDVGTGNARLLLALAARGYADLTGSDYSEGGLVLAAAVAARHGVATTRAADGARARSAAAAALARSSASPPAPHITLVLDDATDTALPPASFDVVTDKGTLDAVALSAAGRAAALRYVACVARVLKPGGVFVVTSANATAEELGGLVGEGAAGGLTYERRVEDYPVFSFGGRTGTRVATVAFRRGARGE